MPDLELVCPECGFVVDKMAAASWGDGNQRLKVAPYICTWCGAASIVNLVTGKVEAVPPAGWKIIEQRNPTLWAAISATQRKIREFRATQREGRHD